MELIHFLRKLLMIFICTRLEVLQKRYNGILSGILRVIDWISNVKGIEADDMPWIILGPSFLFFAAALVRRKSFILWQKTSFNQSKNFLILVKSFFFFWNKCLVRSREEVHFNLEGKHLNYSIRCKYWKEKGTTAPKKSVLDKQNIEAAPSSQWLKNVPKSLICWKF